MVHVRLAFAALMLSVSTASAQPKPPLVYKDTATLQTNLAAKPSLARTRYADGFTLLHFAAMTGDTTGARVLLDASADPNARDKLGQTPLHKSRIAAVAELLMIVGADPSIRDGNGRTAQDVALAHGNKAVAEVIRRYSILSAAANGDLSSVQGILDADPGAVGVRDREEATALHHAAAGGHQAVVELLLANGADVNARKDNGVTPLHVASALGKVEIIKLLIAKGADLDAKDGKGRTPLSLAREKGHAEIERLLVQARPAEEPSEPVPAQEPPETEEMSPLAVELFASILREDLRRVNELLDADPKLARALNEDGQSGLVAAMDLGAKEIAKALISKGADVNAADAEGVTPLFHCTDDADLARLLVSKGANVKAIAKNGRTPLHEVACFGSPEVAELLIACGADVNARDGDGRTPLACARDPEVRRDMVTVLKRHGAKD